MPSAYSRFRVLGSVAALAVAVTLGTGAGTPFARTAGARSETNTSAVRYGTLSAKAARTMAEREISQAQLRDYLTFIASDELEGRDTPSPPGVLRGACRAPPPAAPRPRLRR